MPEPISRRKLFGWLGAGSAAVASRALPIVETVVPKIPKAWDTMMQSGRIHYFDGVKWVKAYSNKFLVK